MAERPRCGPTAWPGRRPPSPVVLGIGAPGDLVGEGLHEDAAVEGQEV